MRIVQTFWTAGQDPLKHAFGWLHPEYNLMSWALSCLSLREHYDEVALYTDSEGKRILIDELHLSIMATKGMREIQIQMIRQYSEKILLRTYAHIRTREILYKTSVCICMFIIKKHPPKNSFEECCFTHYPTCFVLDPLPKSLQNKTFQEDFGETTR